MKKILATILLLFCTCILMSAQGTFNVVYNYSIELGLTDAGGCAAQSVMETDNGYLVFATAVVPGNLGKVFGVRFDSNGGLLGELEHYGATPYDYNYGYIDPVEKDASGSIVVLTEFEAGNYNYSRQLLARFDVLGDTINTHLLLDTGYVGIRQTALLAGGRFAACGFSDPDSVPATALLLVGDTSGSIQVLRNYTNALDALGIQGLSSGGLLLCGYQPTGVDNSIWVMRLDSAGNTIWRRDIGGSRFAFKNVSAVQTQDGGIVATCSFMPLPGSPTDDQWNYFRKWDIDGNVQWTKQYNEQNSTTAYDMEELASGELVACGAEGATPIANHGILMRLEPDGDLIWLRRYAYYMNTSAIHIPYDVEPTADGGFVMTGQARQGSTDSLPGLQMVWLLKVDSMGCLVPGCGNIGVEEIALGLENALQVYPNPTNAHVTVEAALPSDLEVRGDLTLVLVDALGRTVRNETLGRVFTTTILDLSALPKGVYHLHLRDDERWLSGTSVVVE
ncbi:MAG: T9SS type A sorting domain-containing protein [Flavobacteriales bacterium]